MKRKLLVETELEWRSIVEQGAPETSCAAKPIHIYNTFDDGRTEFPPPAVAGLFTKDDDDGVPHLWWSSGQGEETLIA